MVICRMSEGIDSRHSIRCSITFSTLNIKINNIVYFKPEGRIYDFGPK